MSSMKNMCSYLKQVVDMRARGKGPEDASDNEAGVIKQAKKVVQKALPDAQGPISSMPINVASQGQGEDVKSPATKKTATRRRRQGSPEGSNTSASKKLKPSEEGFVSWTDTLAEFTGEGKVQSLWDSRFPVSTFVAEHLWNEDDFSRVTAVGPDQAAIAMQSYGLKIASIGRIFGDELAKLRLQERTARSSLDAAKKSLANQPSLIKENSELKAEVERLKKAMSEVETARHEKEKLLQKTYDETIEKWTKKMDEIRSELDGKSAELAQKDQEIEPLGLKSAEYLVNGFDKAKDQVEALYPELDLSALSVFKTVIDGQVVDEPEETEMEEEVEGNKMNEKTNEVATDVGGTSSLV